MRASLAADESIITREGVWLGPNWLRVTRLGEQQGGVIQRQQELEQLERDLEATAAREQQLELEQQRTQEQLRQLEEQRQTSQRELQSATRQHAEFSAQTVCIAGQGRADYSATRALACGYGRGARAVSS